MTAGTVADMKHSRIIVILGMHRSGTSAMTRGLQTMGVGLGDRLNPVVDGCNPKGFWEDRDLNALNIEMMRALGREWYQLAPLEPADVQALVRLGFLPRAVELLRQRTGGEAPFGFKDPRVAKLLPFWEEAFRQCGLKPGYVLAVRHPFSVASSLAARDGFEAVPSYLLWLGHVLPSLTGSAGVRRVVVDFDRLLQEPEQELSRVARGLELDIDPAAMAAYRQDFLDRNLRHTIYALEELDADAGCPPLVREVYAGLLEAASDRMDLDGPELLGQITRWAEEFARLKPMLLQLDRHAQRELDAAQAAHQRAVHISHLDALVAHLNQTLADHREQALWYSQTLAEREARLAELLQSKSWRFTRPLRLAAHLLRRGMGLDQMPPASSPGDSGPGGTDAQEPAGAAVAPVAQAPAGPVAEHFDEHDFAEWERRFDSLTGEARAVIRARMDAFRRRS